MREMHREKQLSRQEDTMKNVIEESFLAEIDLLNHHTANGSATSKISVI